MTTNPQGSRRVGEIMETMLCTVTPDTVVASARRLASEHNARHLIVLKDGTLAGIVYHKDLQSARSDQMIFTCMNTTMPCVEPAMTVNTALAVMVEYGVSCLPIMAEGFLVGIVTNGMLRGESEEAPEPQGEASLPN